MIRNNMRYRRSSSSLYQSGLLLIFVTFLSAGSARGQGNVLWDISHGPRDDYTLDGDYSDLAGRLRDIGYNLESAEVSLDEHGLWDVDILVLSILSNFDDPYSEDETDRVRSFVEGGGGLIVLAGDDDDNPENQADLLALFGLLAGRDNFIDDIEDFEFHEIFDGVDWLRLRYGGPVDIIEDTGAEILAYDYRGEPGIAINVEMGGPVILIGDAMIWSDRNLAQADNRQFAINCFDFADRERRGTIDVQGEGSHRYLPWGISRSDSLFVTNSGLGPLEFGLEVRDAPEWLRTEPRWNVLEPDSVETAYIIFDPTDLPADSTVEAAVVVNHNDPDHDPVEIVYTLTALSDEPVHFIPPRPSGIDHSLLIEALTIDEEFASPGVEVGVFTPGGICAGAAVYLDDRLGLVARGDNPLTDEIDGFQEGERLVYRVYIPWDDSDIGAVPDYSRGPEEFTEDALTVLDLRGVVEATLEMEINHRWNLVSLNVRPASPDVEDIFAPLVEDELLMRVKDGDGRFWLVERGFNNLPPWSHTAAYKVMVSDTVTFEVEGTILDADMPVPVNLGWNLIPFLPQQEQGTEDALETIWDDLHLVKDEVGIFTIPDWNWIGLRTMRPGEGYKLRMHSSDTLVYPEQVEERAVLVDSVPRRGLPSGQDMSILLMGIKPFQDVRVVSGADIVMIEGDADASGRLGMAIPGDDCDTWRSEGMDNGHRFEVQVLDKGNWTTLQVEWLEGDNFYKKDGLAVGRAIQSSVNLTSRSIEFYPNPFNDRVQILFKNKPTGEATIKVFDITGRLLVSSTIARVDEGVQKFALNSRGWPSGVLFIEIQAGVRRSVFKTVHLP